MEQNTSYPKIGLYFGGFHPLHRGHISCILKAKHENDIVCVFVCGYDNEPRGNELGLTLEQRTELVKDYFKDDPYVFVYSVNDTELGIGAYVNCVNNWRIWCNYVEGFLASQTDFQAVTENITYYVGDSEYKESLECFLNKKVVVIDRTDIPVSGTMIRENPQKYWQYIAEPFRKYMVKKVLVIGTASEGKTSLCQSISEYFNIPWVKEYGRTYMEEHNIKSDEELTVNEFIQFLHGQTQSINEAVEKAVNQGGVMISDTDNLITMMYACVYADMEQMPVTLEQVYYVLFPELDKHIYDTKWDHIIVLTPNNKFVDDGSRYMAQSSMEERQKNLEMLKVLISTYYRNIPITYLPGGRPAENFEYTKNIIEKFGL